jgi:hydrogenase maturation factor
VVRVIGQEATVDTGIGPARKAVIAVPESVQAGDYILLYGDTALNKMDRESAMETLETMKELAVSVAKEEGRRVAEVERLYLQRERRLAGPVRPRSRHIS